LFIEQRICGPRVPDPAAIAHKIAVPQLRQHSAAIRASECRNGAGVMVRIFHDAKVAGGKRIFLNAGDGDRTFRVGQRFGRQLNELPRR
jgi:hypothetical protein